MMMIVVMMKVEEEEEDDEVDEDDVWQEEREEREPSLVRGMRRSPCLAGAEGAPPVDCTPWTQLGYH